MTYLDELVDAFKREVSVPGEFAQNFPATTDDDLTAALGDAFGHAQLDGFFPSHTLDVDAQEIEPDISVAGAALVVLYAGTRMVRQQLRNLGVNKRYKSGPVEYETSVAASLLVQELKDLQGRLNLVVATATNNNNRPTAVFMLDSYTARMNEPLYGYGGFFAGELPNRVIAGELVR